ncbi:YobI family P-loop NTPase [Amycolatopsis sp. NPDC004772]
MTDDDKTTDDAPPIPPGLRLQTLAPAYVAEQHKTYVRHLREAVEDAKNLNIALTGRYGTGKSSVLDEFVTGRPGAMRIAISTLGPDAKDVDTKDTGPKETPKTLTNRIQKELVKQLLYRASPRRLPYSRFNRIVPLSKKRATLEAMGAVGVITGALGLLGLLPHLAGTGPGHNGWLGVLSGAGFAALAVLVLATLRIVIYGRFVVSDVSAAGAAVKLTQRLSTYFDEYLEEIVYFFDTELPEVVVFEDLDRFDDPHIFEALRELNTLLNNTATRVEEKKPLRFVYAIKDSLFEKLGFGAEPDEMDAAQAETVRANRTKFFDIVIPVVPFISHRNARELLSDLLTAGKITGIDRELITLVAQHITDMRLLKNIYNEYIVFAERLLVEGQTAPGLIPSNLFALVVYKNIHLRDFEEIARRGSALDDLYARRQELVAAAIDDRERRKRELLEESTRPVKMGPLAERLGDRLVTVGQMLRELSPNPAVRNWRYVKFLAGSDWCSENEVRSCDFWRAATEANRIVIHASSEKKAGQEYDLGTLGDSRILALFPEAADADRWADVNEHETQAAIQQIDKDIAFLRGADFAQLAADTRFTVPAGEGTTFAHIVEKTMGSKLAVALVVNGHLDRNFALYAAQFYGRFSGADVATFIVQHVQTNTPNVEYKFSGPAAVENLLAEAPPEFVRTVSAYNVDVLDYLLDNDDERAADIARSVARTFDDRAEALLRRYFTLGTWPAKFAARLSSIGWSPIFTSLVEDEAVPERLRPGLVDAALRDAVRGHAYELGDEVRDFLTAHYQAMAVFTNPQPLPIRVKVLEFIQEAGIVFPDLAKISDDMRRKVVEEWLYQITADNLRAAMEADGAVSLDLIRDNADVYNFCLDRPNRYLSAVEDDVATQHAVIAQETLVDVLTTVPETWGNDQVQRLISLAAPSSRLERLDAVPTSCWQDLALHRLFEPSVRNVMAYVDVAGKIDEELAASITEVGRILVTDEEEADRAHVAVEILNAAGVIPDPGERIKLVESLQLAEYLAPSEIEPEKSRLFALLLEHHLVEDSFESFLRFKEAGWPAIGPAITKSSGFTDFLTPELVGGFVVEFLRSSEVPVVARDKVVGALGAYVPDADTPALAAAGRYALGQQLELPPDQLARIAAATRDVDLIVRLLTVRSPLPPAEEVVGVLGELGEPYSFLQTRVKNKFDVPADDAHQKLFTHLKSKGAVAAVTRARVRDRLYVTVVR